MSDTKRDDRRVPGTNTGHGHVWKRPDGMVARCGGPGMCGQCSVDAELVDKPRMVLFSWDYRQQPDLDGLAAAIRKLSEGRLHLHQVDTRGDEYAIVLSKTPLEPDEIEQAYEAHITGEETSNGF